MESKSNKRRDRSTRSLLFALVYRCGSMWELSCPIRYVAHRGTLRCVAVERGGSSVSEFLRSERLFGLATLSSRNGGSWRPFRHNGRVFSGINCDRPSDQAAALDVKIPKTCPFTRAAPMCVMSVPSWATVAINFPRSASPHCAEFELVSLTVPVVLWHTNFHLTAPLLIWRSPDDSLFETLVFNLTRHNVCCPSCVE